MCWLQHDYRSRSILRREKLTSLCTSCSQRRSTLHPSFLSDPFTRLSRSRFRRILAVQKDVLVFGVVPCRGQPCQKHPSTKMASRDRGKARSGLPGSPRPALSRYRKPLRWRALRRASSGPVPDRLTRAMRRLRSSVVGTRRDLRVGGSLIIIAGESCLDGQSWRIVSRTRRTDRAPV